MDKLLYSKRETALILGISVRSVENLIARKLLLSRRVGRRRLVTSASIQQIARQDIPIITGTSDDSSDSSVATTCDLKRHANDIR
jgi:hypothetical protein